MIIVGDVHGEFEQIGQNIVHKPYTNQTFIQVGDLGVGFENIEIDISYIAYLNQVMKLTGSKFYAIRGNHDNPALFAPDSILNKYEYVTLLPDYSLITVDDKKILCVGGGLSIDRQMRKVRKMPYWEDEAFILDKEKLSKLDLSNLFAVVTHNCPSYVPPYTLGSVVKKFMPLDPTLGRDLNNERKDVDKLAEYVNKKAKPKYWFYGHHHDRATTKKGKTDFVLVDIMQFVEV